MGDPWRSIRRRSWAAAVSVLLWIAAAVASPYIAQWWAHG